MNTAKRMRTVLESRRACASCQEMDNPDSYIRHLQSALKWHDEHVPRPTNQNADVFVLEGEKMPEEVLFVWPDGVTHYQPERTCHRDRRPNCETCSKCGYVLQDEWNHCPNCGARIEES